MNIEVRWVDARRWEWRCSCGQHGIVLARVQQFPHACAECGNRNVERPVGHGWQQVAQPAQDEDEDETSDVYSFEMEDSRSLELPAWPLSESQAEPAPAPPPAAPLKRPRPTRSEARTPIPAIPERTQAPPTGPSRLALFRGPAESLESIPAFPDSLDSSEGDVGLPPLPASLTSGYPSLSGHSSEGSPIPAYDGSDDDAEEIEEIALGGAEDDSIDEAFDDDSVEEIALGGAEDSDEDDALEEEVALGGEEDGTGFEPLQDEDSAPMFMALEAPTLDSQELELANDQPIPVLEAGQAERSLSEAAEPSFSEPASFSAPLEAFGQPSESSFDPLASDDFAVPVDTLGDLTPLSASTIDEIEASGLTPALQEESYDTIAQAVAPAGHTTELDDDLFLEPDWEGDEDEATISDIPAQPAPLDLGGDTAEGFDALGTDEHAIHLEAWPSDVEAPSAEDVDQLLNQLGTGPAEDSQEVQLGEQSQEILALPTLPLTNPLERKR